MLTIKAPAKINLTLEVLGKRSDGYHDIKSLMQTIDLCDVLTFENVETVRLECSDPSLQTAGNLVLKAAELLKQTTGHQGGANIHLEKHIPVSAGLGGGSSNAAAALTGLNTLWNCGLKREKLAELAVKLGSDVPFFIYGGMALVEGKGEKITPMNGTLKKTFIILHPDFKETEGKTGRLYSLINRAQYTSGRYTDKAIDSFSNTGDIPPELLYNTFDTVANLAYPGIETCRNSLTQSGVFHAHLAGSGPCLFAMAEDETAGIEKVKKLEELKLRVFSANAF